jgi:acetyl esterase/lipase
VVARARAFEAALRAAGKDIETVYVDGGGHNGLFASAAQYDASVRRIATFLRRHLST